MKTISIVLALVLCISCSKDDSKNNDDYGGQGNLNGFTFEEETYLTDRGEYLDADGNSFLFFVNTNLNTVANTSFIFSKDFEMFGNGTYIFMEDRFDPNYNPDSNFWAGSVSLEDGIPQSIIAGEIIITKEMDGSYIFSYNITIPNGNVIGDYNGPMIPR